jgi:CelD/BcsL family acetyltransferase involved in cellulose biosynthesis
MMQARVVNWDDVTAEEIEVWRRLQQTDTTCDSPFFCPEFTQIAASVRDDVKIAVLEEGEKAIGFFPFQLAARGLATAVAAGFSEFHGPIVESDREYTVEGLLEACGLAGWSYDHLPTCNGRFASFHQRIGGSSYLNLSQGFETYREAKRKESQVIDSVARKTRKLEREVGPVRFQLHNAGSEEFSRLLEWKSAQHLRTGVVDVFEQPWVVSLLRQVRDTQTEHFRGFYSVLSVASKPIAVHLGMRTKRVAHMWYPTYDQRFSAYSPRLIMMLRLARALADEGVERLDLGPGGQPYKDRLKSDSLPVAIGYAERSRIKSAVRRRLVTTRHWVRSTGEAVAGRLLSPMRRWFATS